MSVRGYHGLAVDEQPEVTGSEPLLGPRGTPDERELYSTGHTRSAERADGLVDVVGGFGNVLVFLVCLNAVLYATKFVDGGALSDTALYKVTSIAVSWASIAVACGFIRRHVYAARTTRLFSSFRALSMVLASLQIFTMDGIDCYLAATGGGGGGGGKGADGGGAGVLLALLWFTNSCAYNFLCWFFVLYTDATKTPSRCVCFVGTGIAVALSILNTITSYTLYSGDQNQVLVEYATGAITAQGIRRNGMLSFTFYLLLVLRQNYLDPTGSYFRLIRSGEPAEAYYTRLFKAYPPVSKRFTGKALLCATTFGIIAAVLYLIGRATNNVMVPVDLSLVVGGGWIMTSGSFLCMHLPFRVIRTVVVQLKVALLFYSIMVMLLCDIYWVSHYYSTLVWKDALDTMVLSLGLAVALCMVLALDTNPNVPSQFTVVLCMVNIFIVIKNSVLSLTTWPTFAIATFVFAEGTYELTLNSWYQAGYYQLVLILLWALLQAWGNLNRDAAGRLSLLIDIRISRVPAHAGAGSMSASPVAGARGGENFGTDGAQGVGVPGCDQQPPTKSAAAVGVGGDQWDGT
jgi:hypothetical protein